MPISVRVSRSKPKARRSTEAAFEHILRDIAKEEKALFLKSDATDGWPDRYCGHGVWIEFKSLVFARSISLFSQCRPEQRATMRQLATYGDDPWVCILILHELTETEWVVFCPFAELEQNYPQQLSLDKLKAGLYTYTKEAFLKDFREWIQFNGDKGNAGQAP
jgi:hypothetical protein